MGKTRNDKIYEHGDHDGKDGGFVEDIIVGNVYSKDEIYRKGYEHGAQHRHDSDSRGSSSSGSSSSGGICYLTTVCVNSMNLPDNCLELSVLRNFRDKILMLTSKGRKAVKEYYQIAPEIVQAVNEREDSLNIWQATYKDIKHTVSLVLSEDFEGALRHYKEMSLRFKEKYLD